MEQRSRRNMVDHSTLSGPPRHGSSVAATDASSPFACDCVEVRGAHYRRRFNDLLLRSNCACFVCRPPRKLLSRLQLTRASGSAHAHGEWGGERRPPFDMNLTLPPFHILSHSHPSCQHIHMQKPKDSRYAVPCLASKPRGPQGTIS